MRSPPGQGQIRNIDHSLPPSSLLRTNYLYAASLSGFPWWSGSAYRLRRSRSAAPPPRFETLLQALISSADPQQEPILSAGFRRS